jgi:hypothetical protein
MNVNLAFWQSGLGKQKRQIGKINEQKAFQIPEGSVSSCIVHPILCVIQECFRG